jgi:hypothetical protein
MKFATILFAALGLLASSVAAAPTETTIEIDTRDVQVEMQDLQLRFDDHHPIIQHYFGHPARLNVTEADYAPGAPGTVEIEKRGGIATIAKLVVKGVMAIVNLIKGKIEADKQVRFQAAISIIFVVEYPWIFFALIDAIAMDG